MGLKIRCHSDDRREEESRKRKVDVFEILRFALNDNNRVPFMSIGRKNTKKTWDVPMFP